ncbi:TetR/AcrR family transcriptional regulator [Caryophanon tenue]|uniref:HTH tetR-type domain-containing protein n=1 Tax=Caryophanon tenue TaxID=33978 RepID=A0A1C0YBN8_9BACL|nr:TetR/AcrR family transcriptional regulator [Caryophanon tenue]OCS84592.1 hypothetical protein A6M13_03160 [Caryophanon tenue]
MKLDPRQVKSKSKLHEAYVSLLMEGQQQLTIQQVCQKAGITRPTFYKLYKDTQELRRDIVMHLLAELNRALTIENPKPLAELPEHERGERLTLLFEHVQQHHIAYETMLIYEPDALLTNGIQEILKKYIRNGLHFSDTKAYLIANEELIIAYAAGAYIESLRWWITSNYSVSATDMANVLIELSLNGPYTKRMP